MNRLIPMETYRWAAPVFQCKMSSSVRYMMCSNCQIVHSFQVLLWVSHWGALLWPAVLGSSWNGRQGGTQIKLCLFFSFVSIFAQFHTLATLVGESNVSRTTSKPEAHCSHYQQVTLFTAIKEGSSAVSCKYQKLQITIINFNQSVSRLTILKLMTGQTYRKKPV